MLPQLLMWLRIENLKNFYSKFILLDLNSKPFGINRNVGFKYLHPCSNYKN